MHIPELVAHVVDVSFLSSEDPGEMVEIKTDQLQIFPPYSAFPNRIQLLEDTSVFTKYSIGFNNELFRLIPYLVVECIATLGVAELFVRATQNSLTALQAEIGFIHFNKYLHSNINA
jgi:hypothetical protein